MATLVYGMTSTCFVFVCHKDALDDTEWDAYVDFVRSRIKATPNPRCLALADGAGGPTSAQRARLNEVLKPYANSAKAAVLTASRISVGIVTAMSWFVPGFRAFLPQDIEEAFNYLDIPATRRKEMMGLLEQLQKQLGVRIPLGKSPIAAER